RWFRNAAPRLASSAPAWHRAVALEAARTPWKHFYLRTAEHLVDLLTRHAIVRDPETLQGLEVLDLGCTPHVSVALASLGARVTQFDIAPAELQKGRELARKVGVTTRVRLVLGDAFRPPFAPDSFDVVWNSGFIEHFDDPVRIIQA